MRRRSSIFLSFEGGSCLQWAWTSSGPPGRGSACEAGAYLDQHCLPQAKVWGSQHGSTLEHRFKLHPLSYLDHEQRGCCGLWLLLYPVSPWSRTWVRKRDASYGAHKDPNWYRLWPQRWSRFKPFRASQSLLRSLDLVFRAMEVSEEVYKQESDLIRSACGEIPFGSSKENKLTAPLSLSSDSNHVVLGLGMGGLRLARGALVVLGPPGCQSSPFSSSRALAPADSFSQTPRWARSTLGNGLFWIVSDNLILLVVDVEKRKVKVEKLWVEKGQLGWQKTDCQWVSSFLDGTCPWLYGEARICRR